MPGYILVKGFSNGLPFTIKNVSSITKKNNKMINKC